MGISISKCLSEADKACQLRVLPEPEASPGAQLSLGRGSVAGGREGVAGH